MEAISTELAVNEAYLRKRFQNCDDIIIRRTTPHEYGEIPGLLVYVEGTANALEAADMVWLDSMEEAIAAMLAGNMILFAEGSQQVTKISSKGFPSMSVSEPKTQRELRGSKEGFSDGAKVNSALIRKRIRDSRLKVKEYKLGTRSNTVIFLVYMEDLIYPAYQKRMEKRLEAYTIDAVEDSGMVEQLAGKGWHSPFPQYQTTEHPDTAAMEILNGRMLLLCDNSPAGLLFPSTFAAFMKVGEDRFNRYGIASFVRLLRYGAAFLALLLPALYLAATTFHTQIVPTNLLLSFAQAREGVPFPSLVEVLFMELAFELIREAGVRMPGPLGSTMGIIGGLIIGQAAIDANLVSPIVVVIVALTALCTFAVPNHEFGTAFRLLRYPFILLGGFFGMLGIVCGLFLLAGHLASLTSFGIPYLYPFDAGEMNDGHDVPDALVRKPFLRMRRRPIFARRQERTRLSGK